MKVNLKVDVSCQAGDTPFISVVHYTRTDLELTITSVKMLIGKDRAPIELPLDRVKLQFPNTYKGEASMKLEAAIRASNRAEWLLDKLKEHEVPHAAQENRN